MSSKEVISSGHDLLGPLFYQFLFKLHITQYAYDPQKTMLLFLARGGIRIRAFYEQFLNVNNIESPIPYEDFYISRMAIIKASLLSNYDIVYKDLLNEYNGYTNGEMVATFFGADVYDDWINMHDIIDPEAYFGHDALNQLLWSKAQSSDYLRRVLLDQKTYYFDYLNSTIKDTTENIIIIDTGWSGSILNYMQTLDLQHDYTALYFGRYNYGKSYTPWFNKVIGLEAEHFDFDRKKAISSVFLNRHLIEGLCEIRWKSTSGYKKTEEEGIAEPTEGYCPDTLIFPNSDEAQAFGISKYITGGNSGGLNIKKIHEFAETASKCLCNKLMYPGKKELFSFSVATRSADFGKELDVPMFITPNKEKFDLNKKIGNITRALWPTGQIVLEFPTLHYFVQFVYHRRHGIRKILNFIRR